MSLPEEKIILYETKDWTILNTKSIESMMERVRVALYLKFLGQQFGIPEILYKNNLIQQNRYRLDKFW